MKHVFISMTTFLDMSGKESEDISRKEPTLLNLIHNVRTGQLTTGPLKPNRWLDISVKEKTNQERKIEKVMESCSFKSIMSCVVGMCIGWCHIRVRGTLYVYVIVYACDTVVGMCMGWCHIKGSETVVFPLRWRVGWSFWSLHVGTGLPSHQREAHHETDTSSDGAEVKVVC